MARGRKPMGPKLVEGLDASEAARHRLRVILETITGEVSVPEACEKLSVSEAGFHKLRSQFMQDAVGLLEPKKRGRKPKETSPEEQKLLAAETENRELKTQLAASQIRTEIALVMPHLLIDDMKEVKKTPQLERSAKKKKRRRKR
jgi:transposase-like protein